jgi:hypothetical protein
MIMEKVKKNNRSAKKSRLWIIGIVTTLMIGGFSSNAHAIDIGKFTSSLLTQLKSNSVISGIAGELNRISGMFLPAVKNFTGLTDADIGTIRGVLGQIAPSDAKKEIDNKTDPNNPLATVAKQGHTSVAVSGSVADQVLSKEAQEANKKSTDEVTTLVENSETVAVEATDNAATAQDLSSSQDVLKILSKQSSGQSSLLAAQIRIAAFQNSNLQEIKTQLAASNLANSSSAERVVGEQQEKLVKENQKTTSFSKNKLLSYVQGLF